MASINTEAVSYEYLHVNSCGCQVLYGYDAGAYRPNGRVDYHILYIAQGSCFVTEDGKTTEAKQGAIIVYLPGEPQNYKFVKDIRTKSYYIHFSGTACRELFEKFGFTEKRIFCIEKSTALENLYKNLIEEFYLKQEYYEQSCHSLLLHILTLIGRKIANNSFPKLGRRKEINEICKSIYAQRSNDLSVKDYAKMCNMSESHFAHTFTEIVGVSPRRYIINAKIEMAKDLLKNTDFSIAYISEMAGFKSQNYFSRIFKKYTGISPSDYRIN